MEIEEGVIIVVVVVVVVRILVLGIKMYQSRSPSRDERNMIGEIVPIETGGLSVFRLVQKRMLLLVCIM